MTEEAAKKPRKSSKGKPDQVLAKLDEAIKILDGMDGDVWQAANERLVTLRQTIARHK